jgi:hypothetical protein
MFKRALPIITAPLAPPPFSLQTHREHTPSLSFVLVFVSGDWSAVAAIGVPAVVATSSPLQ